MEGVLNKIVFEHRCGLGLPTLDLGIKYASECCVKNEPDGLQGTGGVMGYEFSVLCEKCW